MIDAIYQTRDGRRVCEPSGWGCGLVPADAAALLHGGSRDARGIALPVVDDSWIFNEAVFNLFKISDTSR
jgi:hypothetical protein